MSSQLLGMLPGLGQAAPANSTPQLAQSALCEIAERLRGQELEYGRPPCDLVPHNPLNLPFVKYGDLTKSTSTGIIDVRAQLGKSVTRGDVTNYGTNNVLLIFHSKDDQQQVTMLLPAGATRATDGWVWDKLEIQATSDGDSSYQIVAQ